MKSPNLSKRFTLVARSAIVAACFLFAAASHAAPIYFEATIDGAQANAGAGTGSTGTGSATMIFEDSTNEFSWDVQWSGLTGPAILAHFHGPASPTENAGVEIDIAGGGALTNPASGSAILDADQASDLLAGLWYINIHTVEFLGGEIRGQVERADPPAIPAPSTLALMLIAAFGIFARKRTHHAQTSH